MLGALPVDGRKNSAPEKERHAKVESVAVAAPDPAPNGRCPDGGIERLQIHDSKVDRAGRSAVDGGQRKRRRRTIETVETA